MGIISKPAANWREGGNLSICDLGHPVIVRLTHQLHRIHRASKKSIRFNQFCAATCITEIQISASLDERLNFNHRSKRDLMSFLKKHI